jgi:hypothetical protein
MTSCDDRANHRDIDKHFAGRISPSEEGRMRAHLGECANCRAYYERHLLLTEMDRGRVVSAEDRIAVGLGLAAARSPRRAPLVAGALLAAAAALVAIAAPSVLPHRSEFASRGALRELPSAELVVYRIPPHASPARLGTGNVRDGKLSTRFDRSDELAFAYTNQGAFPYLLVFGVDEHRHVYWYHPAWTNAADTPRAVAIQTGPEARELPDATSHELDGTSLRVIGLFTRSALTTRDVEARIQSGNIDDVRAAFPEGFTSELVLQVGDR